MDYDYDLIEPIKYYNDTLKDKFEILPRSTLTNLLMNQKLILGKMKYLFKSTRILCVLRRILTRNIKGLRF